MISRNVNIPQSTIVFGYRDWRSVSDHSSNCLALSTGNSLVDDISPSV